MAARGGFNEKQVDTLKKTIQGAVDRLRTRILTDDISLLVSTIVGSNDFAKSVKTLVDATLATPAAVAGLAAQVNSGPSANLLNSSAPVGSTATATSAPFPDPIAPTVILKGGRRRATRRKAMRRRAGKTRRH